MNYLSLIIYYRLGGDGNTLGLEWASNMGMDTLQIAIINESGSGTYYGRQINGTRNKKGEESFRILILPPSFCKNKNH